MSDPENPIQPKPEGTQFSPDLTPPDDIEILRQRNAELEAENQLLRQKLKAANVGLFHDRRHIHELEDKLEHDEQTGLANEATLNTWLEACIEQGTDNLWLIGIDVDRFKDVNDTMGHPAADRVLIEVVGKELQLLIRRGDIAAHLHGDEFAIALAGPTRERVEEIANGLLATSNSLGLSKNGFVDMDDPAQAAQAIRVQMSIGAAEWRPGMSLQQLREQTDRALYDAKEAGRNTFAIRSDRPTST